MTERIRFTRTSIDAIRPRAKRFIAWDSSRPGFGLRVTPRGTRTYVLLYRLDGRKRFLSIDETTALTLEQAIGEYSKASGDIAKARHQIIHEHVTPPQHLDPAQRKRQSRDEHRAARTFKKLWERYSSEHFVNLRKRTTDAYVRMMDVLVLPEIGGTKACDVTADDVFDLLKSVATTAPITVRALDTEAQLRGFFATIEAMKCAKPIKNAIMLILATATRPGEICSLRWPHIDQSAATWTLPASVDKTHQERRIPLSAFAMELLHDAKLEPRVDKDAVFPVALSDRMISAPTLSRAVLDARELFEANGVAAFHPMTCVEARARG